MIPNQLEKYHAAQKVELLLMASTFNNFFLIINRPHTLLHTYGTCNIDQPFEEAVGRLSTKRP